MELCKTSTLNFGDTDGRIICDSHEESGQCDPVRASTPCREHALELWGTRGSAGLGCVGDQMWGAGSWHPLITVVMAEH